MKNYRNSEKANVLLDLLSDPALIVDEKGDFLSVNSAFEEVTGLSRKELIGSHFSKLNILTAEAKAALSEIQKKRMHGEPNEPYEVCFTGKAGETRYVEVTEGKISYAGQPAYFNVLRDVTDRKKKADQQIRSSEEKYKNLFENAPDVIVTFDLTGKITSVNKAIMQHGFKENEIVGRSIFKLVLIEYNQKMLSDLKNVAAGNPSQSEIEILTPNGKRSAECNSSLIWLNSKIVGYQTIIRDVTERKKAEELRKVLERKVKDYSEHLKYMVDLKTALLKDANERLVKSERLAAIGELAGMVGHDLRNPLAGIKNAAYFLKKKGTAISESQAKEMLEIIEKAIGHSDKIINDLLDYAREMHLELIKYDARKLVDEAIRMIQVPDRIQIVNNVDEEIWIWVNADKMMRVFMNLIKNAVDAMPEKGTLKISSCQTKDSIEIAFADTGTGVPKETLPKIFAPLFTTKAQGMGFGLAICKRIVEAHEGTITVETAVNKGTTFTITLPVKPKVEVGGEKTWINMPESLLLTTTKT